jgi:hypothetical protein
MLRAMDVMKRQKARNALLGMTVHLCWSRRSDIAIDKCMIGRDHGLCDILTTRSIAKRRDVERCWRNRRRGYIRGHLAMSVHGERHTRWQRERLTCVVAISTRTLFDMFSRQRGRSHQRTYTMSTRLRRNRQHWSSRPVRVARRCDWSDAPIALGLCSQH